MTVNLTRGSLAPNLILAALGLAIFTSPARSDAQVVTTLHRFVTADGVNPYFGLTLAGDGTLFGACTGATVDGGAPGSVFRMNPDGTSFAVVHAFSPTSATSAYNTGGANPFDGPLIGRDGLLYGVTYQGGSGAYGVLYRVATNGANFTVLRQFSASPITAVEYQSCGIVQGSDGYLYGAGESAGAGDGQLYKVDTNGNNYADLVYFTYSVGGYPSNPLLPGRNGNLYGVTYGDSQDGYPANVGTVYQLTTGGTYTALHNLAGNDGQFPAGGLMEDTHGSLFGTASQGGTYSLGTVFRMATNGTGFTVLHHFGNGKDGTYPLGRLLLASDGNLYGTCEEGGTNGFGAVYRMATNGANYQVLYSFTGNVSGTGDHGYPSGSLIQGNDGKIYGMNGDVDFNYDPPIGNGSIFVVNAIAAAGVGIQSISRASASPTNLSSVQWTVTFSAAVTGVAATNFQLMATGLAGSPAIISVTGSGATWTVTASTGAGTGSLQLNLTNVASISPAITNALPFSGQADSIDLVAPTVAIGSPSAAITAGGPVTYTVTYSDANFNASTLAAGNVTVNGTGTANAGSMAVTGSGSTRTVTLSSLTGNGTLGISLAAGTASDTAGNLAPAAGPGATFTVDNTPPTVTVSAPATSLTRTGPVSFTVTWSDPNLDPATINLLASQVGLNTTGTAAVGSVAVSGTGNTRTVQLGSISGDGSVGISIPASTASDLAGNRAGASAPSATATVDNTPPAIAISSPSVSTTASGPVTYSVTYTGADVVTLAGANITLNQTGSATGAIGISGTGTGTRTITLSSITGSGTLGISIAAGTAADNAGNPAPAAGPAAAITVNTPPVVASDHSTVTVGEGMLATNTGTFSDADGNATVTLSASLGALMQNNGAGTWSWTLQTTNGPQDSQTVTITANDGIAAPVTTTFALSVTNLPPAANAQSVTTFENLATNILLTATDPGADAITNWVITVNPAHGSLSGVASNLTYTPGTNFSGADSFQFTATDRDGGVSAPATVSITVAPVNQPPVAGTNSIARVNNTRTAKVTKATLLANDSDPENDPLAITGVGNAIPAGATVTIAGSFIVYTAPATNSGNGSFTYNLSDGPGGHTVVATVPVVEIAAVPSGAGPNSAQITASGGNYVLTFIGVPGNLYRVQYTTNLISPYLWTEFNPLAILTAPTNGVFSYTDMNPPGPMRLYRAVPHP